MVTLTYALLWLLVLLQAAVIVILIKQVADLRDRAESDIPSANNRIPLGSPAPEFTALDVVTGQRIRSSTFRGQRVVLFFLSTDCGLCRRFAAQLASLSTETLKGLVVYCSGTERSCHSYFSELADKVPVVRKEEFDVPAAYRIGGFPAMVILDAAWRVAGYRYPSEDTQMSEILSTATTSAHPDSLPQPA